MNVLKTSTRAVALASLLSGAVAAVAQEAAPEEAPSLMKAITEGTTGVNLRLRYEGAQQDNGKEDADALTARLRLKYVIGGYYGFKVGAEFEGTRAADENGYNAAGVSGDTNKVVIADPPSTEFN